MTITWASHEHDEKSTFFLIFLIFDCFRLCKRMRKHAFAGQNTQHMEPKWDLQVKFHFWLVQSSKGLNQIKLKKSNFKVNLPKQL